MTTQFNNLASAERIGSDLSELERIGKGEGRGVTRLAYTLAEDSAHDYIRRQMEAIGMATRTDGAGNLYGISNGGNGREIVVGSHLDSVTEGGNYDGALGIVIGIETARVLAQSGAGISLEIVAFRAEESARFGVGCLGSKLATGHLTPQQARAIVDRKGITLYDAIRNSGFDPDKVKTLDESPIKLYIEPHIEQGRVLETRNAPVGIVTGIAAPVRYSATIVGKDDHSGATPMGMRQDALAAFSEMNSALEQLAIEAENIGLPIRATIGYVTVEAGTINKVPGKVIFPVDIRAPILPDRNRFEDIVLEKFRKIAGRRGVMLKLEETERGTPVMLNEEDYAVIVQAVKAAGVPEIRLPSGAGHDAQYVALLGVPTAMLFVRNSGGSHNPNESIKLEDAVVATNVLVNAVTRAWLR